MATNLERRTSWMATKKRPSIIILGAVLLLASAFGACVRGPDDATLTNNVNAKLAANNLSATSDINVTTNNGIVTLNGTVNSEAAKNQAEQTAKSVEGVKSVTNNLIVKPPAPVASVTDDVTLKSRVEANLTKYGVKGITVDVANGEVTLSGNIQKSKLQDAMKAANEASPKRV